MSTTSPNYHNYIYATIVLVGITICAATIYTSAKKITDFEYNTSRIHRMITVSEVELDTLENEALLIEETIKSIQLDMKNKATHNKALKQDFFSLKNNITSLRTDIAEKQKLLISLNLLKANTLSQIKTLFWINTFLLVFGSLMVLGGSSALIFKLEIFQERRAKKRQRLERNK